MGMFSTTLKFSWISTKGNVISLTAVNFSVPYCNILGLHLVSEGLRLDLIDTGLFAFFNVGFSSLFVFRKFLEAIAAKFHYSALFTIFRLAKWVNYFPGFFLQPRMNELLIVTFVSRLHHSIYHKAWSTRILGLWVNHWIQVIDD